MCVGIPARVLEVTPGPMPMCTVDLAGTRLACCLAYVPDAEVGDFVLMQNGFAVQRLDQAAAAQSLAAFAELGMLAPEVAAD